MNAKVASLRLFLVSISKVPLTCSPWLLQNSFETLRKRFGESKKISSACTLSHSHSCYSCIHRHNTICLGSNKALETSRNQSFVNPPIRKVSHITHMDAYSVGNTRLVYIRASVYHLTACKKAKQ